MDIPGEGPLESLSPSGNGAPGPRGCGTGCLSRGCWASAAVPGGKVAGGAGALFRPTMLGEAWGPHAQSWATQKTAVTGSP